MIEEHFCSEKIKFRLGFCLGIEFREVFNIHAVTINEELKNFNFIIC